MSDFLFISNSATPVFSTTFRAANENDIIAALKSIQKEYGNEIARYVEKMFRLETANFKSKVFKNTNSAGLLWNEKYFKHRDKYCVWVKPKYDEKGNLIRNEIVPENTPGAKKFCYVVFPTIYDGMRFLAIYLKKYGIPNAIKRWGGSEKYVSLVNSIKNKYV